jgi:glycosyltransferase involved in cell wall biosynthesis
MTSRLWIDVEDLFEFAGVQARPSGIQRMAYEMFRVLQARHGADGRVRFVRIDFVKDDFYIVPWAAIEALFSRLVSTPPPLPPRNPEAPRPDSAFRRLTRGLAYRVPTPLRRATVEASRSQAAALRACARLFMALARGSAAGLRGLPARLRPAAEHGEHESFAAGVAPGDVFLLLGASWSHPGYAAMVSRRCRDRGAKFGVLIYDLIPYRHPEWCDRHLVPRFCAWIDSILPISDRVFAISHATAADVEAYAREHRIALPGPVRPIPTGSGFSGAMTAAERTPRLPPPGTYALIVSTIEARKNHLLLFRVWRQLLADLPREQVPTLVFAGRIGWLVADLMQQIANTDGLGGKLVVIQSPSDAELAALYEDCRFTLFPSFAEGWGLPVTESLCFGKPCLIADRTSLPEAGNGLARGFDPDNLHDAYRVIREVVEDPAGLAAWEAEIRARFKPTPWEKTVATLLEGLDWR